jgi:nicotinamide phosphoribosyltransferase
VIPTIFTRSCEKLWGKLLRDKALKREGVLVVRPDSGYPRDVALKVLEIPGQKFGHDSNSKGYRVLNFKVRVIQGDGANYWTIQNTLTAMEWAGWSADNITFGMGGALLQQLDRDAQKVAFKTSGVTINGEDHPVYKDPVDGHDKISKHGRLDLRYANEKWSTKKIEAGKEDPQDLLRTVFKNGEVLVEQSVGGDSKESKPWLRFSRRMEISRRVTEFSILNKILSLVPSVPEAFCLKN